MSLSTINNFKQLIKCTLFARLIFIDSGVCSKYNCLIWMGFGRLAKDNGTGNSVTSSLTFMHFCTLGLDPYQQCQNHLYLINKQIKSESESKRHKLILQTSGFIVTGVIKRLEKCLFVSFLYVETINFRFISRKSP